MKRNVLLVLLVPLSIFIVFRGIIPGLTKMDTDFPNYYAAGVIARTGAGVDQMYDDIWFQKQIQSHGIDQQGKFSPFPPPTAVFFIPFSYLTPIVALRWMTFLNVIALIISVWLVSKLFDFSHLESITFALFSGWGLANCFRFGQMYLLVSLAVLAAFYLSRRRAPTASGVIAGLFMTIKYFPIVVATDYLLKKNWRALVAMVLTCTAIFALSILVLGWEIHRQFFSMILGSHLQSDLSGQNPFSSTYQSFDSLLRRLFILDSVLNPQPLVASSIAFAGAKALVVVTILGSGVYCIGRLRQLWASADLPLAVVSFAVLLVAPATATYHFLLLWLPVGMLIHYFRQNQQSKFLIATIIMYAAVGFLPYSFFHRFEGKGLLTLFAYPRLWLLLVLYAIALNAVIHAAKSSRA